MMDVPQVQCNAVILQFLAHSRLPLLQVWISWYFLSVSFAFLCLFGPIAPIASNQPYYPRTYSSTISDLLLSVPFYIYWFISLILPFFLLDVLLRLIFFPHFFPISLSFFLHVVWPTFLTSILSLGILFSLFCSFLFAFFIAFVSQLFMPLSLCLPLYVVYCVFLNFLFLIFFSISTGIYRQPCYTNYSCSL